MASIQKEIATNASVDQVWSALSDIGALHTRRWSGFRLDTRLNPARARRNLRQRHGDQGADC